jgi:sugar lactone lactonase YvrE
VAGPRRERPSVEAVVNDRAILGESPIWSPAEYALYWVDIKRQTVYRLWTTTGRREQWNVGSDVGSIGLRAAGGLVLAMRSGLSFLDTSTGRVTPAIDPEPGTPETRLNDGKVDRAGRYWVGSTHDRIEPVGQLYSISPQLVVTSHATGIIMPNAVAWSPDDKRMYFADSYISTIWAYDFDLESGTVRNRREFARLDDDEGKPDGATVDAEGYLWNARINAGVIARHAPDGRVERIIELPTKRPTCVAFGGDDLRTLYVTTSISRMEPAQLEAEPLAGAVLAFRVDVPGVAEPAFGG